jgi:SAM-dependent methyltransferase
LPETGQPFDPANFDPTEYGRSAAADYDSLYGGLDSSDAVETLARLAAGGAVVEFGIGTGRLALSLAERGLIVHGIDGSPDMVAVLRSKKGGESIPVVIGDFAKAIAGTDFALAVLAINTVYALPSQDAQVECFRNAARHLRPGGHFVVEAWVPDVGAFRHGTAVRPVQIRDQHVELEVARIHPADQTMLTTKVHLAGDGVRLIPANHRYAWPCEMDLMARLAGMRLVHRWENWKREQFQDESTAHISVWEKLPAGTW